MIETEIFETYKIKEVLPALRTIEDTYCKGYLDIVDDNYIKEGLLVLFDKEKNPTTVIRFESEEEAGILYMALNSLNLI